MRLGRAFLRTGNCLARALLLGVAALLLSHGAALAQQTPTADTKDRIEQLEKEVQALKEALRHQDAVPIQPATVAEPFVPNESPTQTVAPPGNPTVDPAIVTKIIEDWSKEKESKEAARKQAEGEKRTLLGFVVGDDRSLKASWDAGGFRFKTDDEAFSAHLGGRLMTDDVWWNQSPNLRKPPNPLPGSPLSQITGVGPGIGDLQDGFFIRRARVVADGTIFQTVEFKVEFDFENYNNLLFDESYVGVKDLPVLETVRVGQTHCPFGLEAYTSSRFLPLMERSPLFDAFYQEFAPGIFLDRTFLDQRVTTQHMFHRVDTFSQFNGASFGDGKYAYSGRISFLPIFEAEGRSVLHLGFAYQIRKGSPPLDFNGGTVLPSTPGAGVTDTTDLVRFRARPGLRDAVGLQGLNSRVVDTGNIVADHVQSINGELMWYWGSWWVQSEACLAHVDNAAFPASNQATSRGDLNYYGSYFQTGYFLTGDNRGYDKRMGKYDRVRPLENFFLVRDENGKLQYGLGAWEVLYRYGFVNLNDDLVRGGIYGEHTIGLNWYWNSNVKLQFNYINGHRHVPPGAESGTIQGFGARAALEF